MSFDHAGIQFENSPSGLAEFARHVEGHMPTWATGITHHHTAAPSLTGRTGRPDGLLPFHVDNIVHYYKHQQGWPVGPHIFVDDFRISLVTPLTERGIHAKSFNATHIGIETLGDYDHEDPTSGRGLECWRHTARVAITLSNAWSQLSRWNFHRDDRKTDKTCAGTNISKEFYQSILEEQRDMLANTNTSTQSQKPVRRDIRIDAMRLTDGDGGNLLAPIAATLASLGLDDAYDSGNWKDIKPVYYDEETETSYAPLKDILNTHELEEIPF